MSTRRVVITGAGRGLGLEITRTLIAQGHTVYGAVRNIDGVEALRSLEPAAVLELDLSDRDSIRSFGDALAEETPAVDILVNNAGISSHTQGIEPDQAGPWTVDPEMILAMINTNAVGPLLLTRSLIGLLEAGDNPIVLNTSSQLGSITYGGKHASDLAYNVSKAALNMVTATCASTNAKVCFVALHPGWVKTDMGSEEADLDVSEAAAAIVDSLLSLTHRDSGRFIRWDGSDHPW